MTYAKIHVQDLVVDFEFSVRQQDNDLIDNYCDSIEHYLVEQKNNDVLTLTGYWDGDIIITHQGNLVIDGKHTVLALQLAIERLIETNQSSTAFVKKLNEMLVDCKIDNECSVEKENIQIYSVIYNSKHGAPLTAKEIKKGVQLWLLDPELQKYPNGYIAKRFGRSLSFPITVEKDMADSESEFYVEGYERDLLRYVIDSKTQKRKINDKGEYVLQDNTGRKQVEVVPAPLDLDEDPEAHINIPDNTQIEPNGSNEPDNQPDLDESDQEEVEPDPNSELPEDIEYDQNGGLNEDQEQVYQEVLNNLEQTDYIKRLVATDLDYIDSAQQTIINFLDEQNLYHESETLNNLLSVALNICHSLLSEESNETNDG